ncbi:MAG: YhcN/YlaJ family sporulation lipoprotein [Clostridia bacterium]|nr:YhcN/YlaJ family sporulation lipoprotein [Clostridia bacterium]
MKRILFLTMLTLAMALMLTGCASNADTTPTTDPGGMGNATAQPLVPSNIPQTTDQGLLGELGNTIGETLSGGSNAALSTAEEALKASQELRDAVQKLTEVDTAVAAAAGNTALVGVTFNSSYQGAIDDRLNAMVLDRAKTAFSGIDRIAVTSNADEIDQISSLYQMLQSGSAYATVKADLEALASKMDIYQK